MKPLVSVLMPVRDGEAYLQQAVTSVLEQDLDAFELLAVDDGSVDSTPEMLKDLAESDARLRIIRNEESIGVTKALNVGLMQARGQYVARIDGDDVCFPDRLSRQFAFLERHSGHVGIGCGFDVIDRHGRRVRTVSEALDDWQVRWLLGFNPPAPHSTAMFRRILDDGTEMMYDERFRTAQDFDLWSRLSEHGQIAVLSDVLVQYRRHSEAITVRHRREQAANCRIVGQRNLAKRLPASIVESLEPLLALFAHDAPATREMITAAICGCDAMLAYDLLNVPSARHRRWMRQMVAGVLADAILSRGGALRSLSATMSFLVHARWHLPPLIATVASRPGAAWKSLATVDGRRR